MLEYRGKMGHADFETLRFLVFSWPLLQYSATTHALALHLSYQFTPPTLS